jgi:PAS domain S-box-containing protein
MTDKIKQCFWNLFSSGLPVDHDLEALRKIFLLKLMFLLGSFFLVLLGTIEFYLQDLLLSTANLSFFLLLLGFFFYLRKTKNYHSVSLIGTAIAGFFFLFLIAYGGIGNTAYMWAFTYPLISIFLLGTKKGSTFSLILLTMACIVFAFGENIVFFTTYNNYLKLRFIPTFITISLLAFVMEKTREIFRGRLESAKSEIEKTVGKLEKANTSLRESEAKYRTFFNTSRDCVYISSIDGCMLDINDAAVDFFGYDSKEELWKIKIPDLYANKEDRANAINIIKEKGYAREYPLKMRKKDGTIIQTLITTVPKKDGNGNIIAFQGSIRDITEKMAMEDRLRQAQKMEALGTLAGGVAHDLNNVLSGIVGYPDLLLLQLPENSPLRKPVLAIQETGLKAAAIVQDLLTLARMGVATYEVLNLNTVISEYLESPEYEKMKSFYPDVEVEARLEADLKNISGSPVHILKVIMNLVSNSAEAIGEKGKIAISTHNRYIDSPVNGYKQIDEGDYVTLIVSDSGIGISAEDMERIFEPFYTKKKMGKSGTGLGMAVVWGTVKDHKGYIDVQSTEGKGSTFTLSFPVTNRKPIEVQSSLPIENYMGQGQSVIVVDDVKEQRELASEMLKTLGYSVTAVSSGEEAVEYLRNTSADLLILDMIMNPGIDGLETYKRILGIHPGQKAIVASGYSETSRVKEAHALGAGQYIKKPYTLEKIGIAAKNELEKK